MSKNNDKWWRLYVGGLWEEIGKLQINFLIANGLLPHNTFLDVGCGSLRGGIHFIDYLKPGNYYGIDKEKNLLDAGLIEIKENNLISKNPNIIQMDNFDLSPLNKKFDFVIAQSVFTHLPLNDIIKCILNVEKVLSNDGKFYATFFENNVSKFNLDPITHPRTDGPDIISYFDKDPFHYHFSIFEWICHNTTLITIYIWDWKHPRNQKIMVFQKQ